VADRFHLLQSLRQRIEAELAGIRAPTGAVSRPPSLMTESGGNGSARTRMAARDLRELMFNRVRSLHEAGESAEAIRLATGLGRHRTVRKWIRLKTLPPRQRMAPKMTTPSAFEAYLRRRWTEGCTHVRTLLAEFANLASQAVSHDCPPSSPRGERWMLTRQHQNRAGRPGMLLPVRRLVLPSCRSCRVIRPPAA
jgi:hypothetical protein